MDVTGIGSIASLATGIIDRIWPNKSDPAYIQAQTALLTAQTQGAFKQMDADLQIAVEQIKANAAEAATPGFHFRDGAGWVCVIAFAIMALKAPIEWASALSGHPVSLPSVDTSVTTDMLLGLLGLGGMHAWQQAKS